MASASEAHGRLQNLQIELDLFAADRASWGSDSPRELGVDTAVALGAWLERVRELSDAQILAAMHTEERAALESGLTAVFVRLVRLADVLDVDLFAAADRATAPRGVDASRDARQEHGITWRPMPDYADLFPDDGAL